MGLGDANYNDRSDQANKFNQQIHIISNKIQQFSYNVYNVDAIEALIIISKPSIRIPIIPMIIQHIKLTKLNLMLTTPISLHCPYIIHTMLMLNFYFSISKIL